MTPAEIIAAAREIVNASTPCATHSYSHQHAVAERHALTVARELLRLHDGAEYSIEPPTDADWYWWKERIDDEPSPRWFDGDPSMLNGGFWLRAEPATASAMAALRAENERLMETVEVLQDGLGLAAINADRDRLVAELAEAKAELETTKDNLAQLRLHILKEGSDKLNKKLAELELAKHVSQATMRMEIGTEAKAALDKFLEENLVQQCLRCNKVYMRSKTVSSECCGCAMMPIVAKDIVESKP